jgi:hypothetical protein
MRTRSPLALALVVPAFAALPAGAADTPHGMFTPSEIKWGDAPSIVPKGAKLAVLQGDPNKNGLFGHPGDARRELPDRGALPSHR